MVNKRKTNPSSPPKSWNISRPKFEVKIFKVLKKVSLSLLGSESALIYTGFHSINSIGRLCDLEPEVPVSKVTHGQVLKDIQKPKGADRFSGIFKSTQAPNSH